MRSLQQCSSLFSQAVFSVGCLLGLVTTGFASGGMGDQILGAITQTTGVAPVQMMESVMNPATQGNAAMEYLKRRGTASLMASYRIRMDRVSRRCQMGSLDAATCAAEIRGIRQDRMEVERLGRLNESKTASASELARLAATVYAQEVREEVMPAFAQKNRRVFAQATRKAAQRQPASAAGKGPQAVEAPPSASMSYERISAAVGNLIELAGKAPGSAESETLVRETRAAFMANASTN